MWAMTLYRRRHLEPAGVAADLEAWARSDAELEGLVFASLPSIGDDPLLQLAAARLLASICSGAHLDRAEALVEAALAGSVAFAAALPVMAQIRGWKGDIAGALTALEDARELAEPASEFEVFLLVLRAQLLQAAGDWAALRAQMAELARIKPETDAQIGLLFAQPGETGLSAGARRRLAGLDAARAQVIMRHKFQAFARRFQKPEHRANMMAGLLDHLTRRFGPDVVPPEVRRDLKDDPNTGATMSG
jgi:hypothetical protein